jgi:hypothetical protein
MSYTSGNKAPTLMAQAPNRVGNHSKLATSHSSGVTAVTGKLGGLMQPAGNQGPAPHARATDNTASGATAGRKQAVMLMKPKGYDGACHNDGYMSKSTTNYLK